jgi:signal transduction histidine kinase/ActR/RegA family two-component response regulator
LTAFDQVDEQVEQAYALGAVDFLFKPIVAPIFISKVAVFVDLHRKTKAIQLQEQLLREAQEREHQQLLLQERARSQRLEGLGHLAAGIAHDFNNMLGVILASASLVRQDLPEGSEAREMLGDIEDTCERATGLTRQLLTFARGGAPVRKLSEVSKVIRDSVGLSLRGSATDSSFQFEAPLWPVELDVAQITQVLSNLVLNARDAMHDQGTLTVRAKNIVVTSGGLPLEPGEYVEIAVEDHGHGIEPGHEEEIFDPYFSTKPGHHGLGLASAYSIVRRHSGLLRVESKPGEATTFYVYLRASPGAEFEEVAPDSELYAGGGHILVMDDEPLLRELLADSLTALECRVDCAAHGDDAVALYKQAIEHRDPFDVVILDLTVRGGKGGAETLRELQAIDPNVCAIACSGYANDAIMCDHAAFGFADALEKPFRFAMLARAVRRQMGKRHQAQVRNAS